MHVDLFLEFPTGKTPTRNTNMALESINTHSNTFFRFQIGYMCNRIFISPVFSTCNHIQGFKDMYRNRNTRCAKRL